MRTNAMVEILIRVNRYFFDYHKSAFMHGSKEV